MTQFNNELYAGFLPEAGEARRAGLLARFLYAFGYRIGGDAWRENRRPRLR